MAKQNRLDGIVFSTDPVVYEAKKILGFADITRTAEIEE